MSAPDYAAPVVQPRCPACGTPVAPDQNWCLQCGAAARTRIAPTPRWRTATGVLLALILLSIAAIGFGVARLLRSDTAITPPPTTITRTITGAAPAAPVAPATTPLPVPRTPAATTPLATPSTPTAPSRSATTPPASTPTQQTATTTPTVPTSTAAKPKR